MHRRKGEVCRMMRRVRGRRVFMRRPVWRAWRMPFAVRGGSYGVGLERCHSGSSWSRRAPWRRKKSCDGGPDDEADMPRGEGEGEGARVLWADERVGVGGVVEVVAVGFGVALGRREMAGPIRKSHVLICCHL
jgi:hypothetical protein